MDQLSNVLATITLLALMVAIGLGGAFADEMAMIYNPAACFWIGRSGRPPCFPG